MKTLFLIVFIFVSGFVAGSYKKEILSSGKEIQKSLNDFSLMKRAEKLMNSVKTGNTQKKQNSKNSSKVQERELDFRWVYAKQQKEFNPENNARCFIINQGKNKHGKFSETFCQGNRKLQLEVQRMIASKK